MDTIEETLTEPTRPRRRLYSPSLKAKIIRECLCPGGSIAFVAREYDINDNLLHRWIREAKATVEVQPKNSLSSDTGKIASLYLCDVDPLWKMPQITL